MTVLLMEGGDQTERQLLSDAVEERGHEVVTVDVHDWPGGTPLRVGSHDADAVVGTEIDYEAVTGTYVDCHRLFRPFEPRFEDRLDDEFRPALNQLREYRGVFESLCRILEYHGADVVPRLRNQYWQERKPWQLYLYEDLDVPVPDTVFTNDPDEVRSFCERHDRVVFKSVTRGGLPHVVTDDDLTEDRLAELATAPVQFQEYVEGEDLRIYVLDGEVVGAIAYESESFSFKYDLKEGKDIDVRPATLSEDLVDSVTSAAERAGLTYTAADVRRRPDGTYKFLELNEVPKFTAADTDAGQNVAGALAEFLID